MNVLSINSYPEIEGFHKGVILSNIVFYLSNEVFEWSNSSFTDSYVKDVYTYFISKKLKNNNIDISKFKEIVLVIAHGKSDDKEWKIYSKKDCDGVKMETFLSKLPKDIPILLYVCNTGSYKIDDKNYKLIYPKTNTGVDDLKFYISDELLEEVS